MCYEKAPEDGFARGCQIRRVSVMALDFLQTQDVGLCRRHRLDQALVRADETPRLRSKR
jgi:hypothetical protein